MFQKVPCYTLTFLPIIKIKVCNLKYVICIFDSALESICHHYKYNPKRISKGNNTYFVMLCTYQIRKRKMIILHYPQ